MDRPHRDPEALIRSKLAETCWIRGSRFRRSPRPHQRLTTQATTQETAAPRGLQKVGRRKSVWAQKEKPLKKREICGYLGKLRGPLFCNEDKHKEHSFCPTFIVCLVRSRDCDPKYLTEAPRFKSNLGKSFFSYLFFRAERGRGVWGEPPGIRA